MIPKIKKIKISHRTPTGNCNRIVLRPGNNVQNMYIKFRASDSDLNLALTEL